MNITIVGKDGNVFPLSHFWSFESHELGTNNSMTESFMDGGRNQGNNRINSKEINLTGFFKKGMDTDSQTDVNEKVSELVSFFINKAPIKLYVNDYHNKGRVKYLEKGYLKADTGEDVIYSDMITKTLTLIFENPYWNYYMDSQKTFSAVNNYEFLLVNYGNFKTPLKFTITLTEDSSGIVLTNAGNNNRKTRLIYAFKANDVIVLDGENNIATLNGNEVLYDGFNGLFPLLVPGNNNWTYEGGAATLAAEWANRE